jgi:isopentenyl diphosphate isomerase/L-lactate dehydrogenase-like FMN-dependent dehydrogenase
MAEREVRRGDTSEITRAYFDGLLLEMRHIDSVAPDTSVTVFGERFGTPIMFAALSHLDRTHPGGMVEAAQGVVAAGAAMWAGMGDETELEGILSTGAKTVKIIKPYADASEVLRKIEHAQAHGALAVGMDVDHAFGSAGSWGTVLGIPMKPQTFEDIRGYVRSTDLPFVVKGVLSLTDALKCLDAGVKGIVISHHHGMVDYALPPLQILPKIKEAVRDQMAVFVDCGIERGLDAFKALALGADAVSVGRALMPPLRDGGAEGVRKCIETMTQELHWAMAVTGSRDVGHIDPNVLWRREA